jgi:hypothetical protein
MGEAWKTIENLKFFHALSIAIYDRLSDPASKPMATPLLVLICSWTQAHSQHVDKYSEEYRHLFPLTPIMIIPTSIKDLCFRTSSQKARRLKPAVEWIHTYLSSDKSGSSGKILMHVFSEGGSHKACEVAEAYQSITGDKLPVSALYFDSTPGRPRYTRLCKAINNSLPPNPLLDHTKFILSGALVGCIWVLYCTFKDFDTNIITSTRARVIDPVYWDLSVPRCYLYSKADTLVSWRDIEDHAKQSAAKGITVTEKVFDQTQHVQHARLKENKDMYWGTIKNTWKDALAIKAQG